MTAAPRVCVAWSGNQRRYAHPAAAATRLAKSVEVSRNPPGSVPPPAAAASLSAATAASSSQASRTARSSRGIRSGRSPFAPAFRPAMACTLAFIPSGTPSLPWSHTRLSPRPFRPSSVICMAPSNPIAPSAPMPLWSRCSSSMLGWFTIASANAMHPASPMPLPPTSNTRNVGHDLTILASHLAPSPPMRFEYIATSSSFGSDANASANARAPRGPMSLCCRPTARCLCEYPRS
mmetsp:Transcript_8924/g.40546  ORF Transcript_8924/g.40546 Transcript_8924/m.40546 type:complete len:235 (+) Transcript_8924:193-897(+)